MKVWIYCSRNSEPEAYYNFADARKQQDEDNRITVEEIIEDGDLEVGGSEEEGYFYIDDGGDIRLVEVR